MKLYTPPVPARSPSTSRCARPAAASTRSPSTSPSTSSPDGASYLDVSPRGYVPLLQLDDGSRHTEAASLLQWVRRTSTRAGR